MISKKQQDWFKKTGLKPVWFDEGWLAMPSGLEASHWHYSMNIPTFTGKFENCFMTCFCRTIDELIVALSTAKTVADYMSLQRIIAGTL